MRTLLVTEADVRPKMNGSDRCGYCPSTLGAEHAKDCVCRRRSVVIRATVEYGVLEPESWDAAMIESHRNDGCWCATNMLSELAKVPGCLCSVAAFEFVRVATPDDDERILTREESERVSVREPPATEHALLRQLLDAFWYGQWETRNAAENNVCAYGCGEPYEDWEAHESNCDFPKAWEEMASIRARVGDDRKPRVKHG